MAELFYNLKRLEKSIFCLYEDIKTPDDILNTWSIDEKTIQRTIDHLFRGKSLVGGSPQSKIKKILGKVQWLHIFDPPVDDEYKPLWSEATSNQKEVIETTDDLCSILLIFAIENGNPDQFISDED